MTTIPRSHKRRIAELQAAISTCHVHTLSGNFVAEPVDPARAWEVLDSAPHARLIDRGDGRFTVRLHSNCWYDLRLDKTGDPR